MKCPHCSTYIPDGLFLKNCLQCNGEVSEIQKVIPVENQSNQKPIDASTVCRKNCHSNLNLFKSEKVIVIIFLIGSIFLCVFFRGCSQASSKFSGRSYYISSQPVTNGGYPANRIYRKVGNFYTVMVSFPQDLFSPVGGYETFLTRGSSTHQSSVCAVSNSENKVRFKIIYFYLKSEDGKKFKHVNYHSYMTAAVLKTQGVFGSWPEALKKTVALIPKADFQASSDSSDRIYYGHSLKKPPPVLILGFKIEVYTVDGSLKDTVTDTVRLSRVDEDPKKWTRLNG